MRPYIFTPGDLICRKGEVAREMFIIADGVLEVIGKGGIVLKRLEAGDFFGEIGILCINGGGNKRTADVRAVGYAELFVLSREDVLSALTDHPDAHTIIVEHATQRLIESKSREGAEVSSFTNKRNTDAALSDSSEITSTQMRSNSEAAAAVAYHEMAMPGPSRTSGFGGSTPPAPNLQPSPSTGTPLAQTSIAVGTYTQRSTGDPEQHQTFAAKKDNFMNREKDVMNSIADLNRFLKEAMV
ncbi:unnamed protein product [Hymenolepis diminuta]|uniref:Cyclic nucleotide-binding domain-containing protein n=1 Tax=Hymenolepis diminuta TaxID=6216 RepID=A0A158QEU0_HYMDI|nr:unnamed protein product [Hymenolepis diminuta]